MAPDFPLPAWLAGLLSYLANLRVLCTRVVVHSASENVGNQHCCTGIFTLYFRDGHCTCNTCSAGCWCWWQRVGMVCSNNGLGGSRGVWFGRVLLTRLCLPAACSFITWWSAAAGITTTPARQVGTNRQPCFVNVNAGHRRVRAVLKAPIMVP